MRRLFLLCLLVALVCLTSACEEEELFLQQLPTLEQQSLSVNRSLPMTEQLQQSLLLRRVSMVKPQPDPSLLAGWQGARIHDLSFTSAEQAFSAEAVYSPEAVRADLTTLFHWFESAYGPYYYFGGAEAFEAAQERLLVGLTALPQITGGDLEAALLSELAFINDAHLRLNGQTTQPALFGYLGEIGLLPTETGWLNAQTGQAVQSIDGVEDFTQQLVFSADATGALVYRYLLLAESCPPPLSLHYADGSTAQLAFTNAHQAAVEDYQAPEDYLTLTYQEDVPVLTLTAMGFDQAAEDQGAQQFLAYAEELKEEPVLILDLRGNPGGNGLLPQKWLELYTGQIVPTNYYQLRRYDVYAALSLAEDEGQNSATYIPQEEFAYYCKPQRLNASWGLQDALPDRVVRLGERLLIVLVSKETASAADIFTDLCYNIDKTLVIGSNTAGQLLSNAFVGIQLPETGLLAQIGNTLDVFDPEHFQENRGFLPDLWVTDDALAVALALYHSL